MLLIDNKKAILYLVSSFLFIDLFKVFFILNIPFDIPILKNVTNRVKNVTISPVFISIMVINIKIEIQ